MDEKSQFVEGWEFIRTLGEGAYGEVKLAIHKDTGECVAVKIVEVDPSGALTPECLKKEVRRCTSTFTQGVWLIVTSNQKTFCSMDMGNGPWEYGMGPPGYGPFGIWMASWGLVCTLEYGMAPWGYDVLKISDFGLSTVFRHMGKERKLNRKCGTPPYVAPEVFAGLEYFAEPADVWSCGIVLVALLAGELPWDTPTSDCAEYREWCYQNYFFSPWTKISNEPLALLKKILRQAPSKRHTLESIKKHLWYRKSYPVVTQSPSQEALSLVSPSCQHTRRVKVESSPRYGDRPGSDVVSSQPVNAHCEDVGGDGKVTVESFTQPSTFDEIVLGTQIPCTPGASQNLFQRLTLRMTRFYTNLASAKVWSRLNQIMKSLAFETRTSMDQASLMISTMDRRKQPLSFKVSIYELKSDLLLVEFRRSKGDGIEFKKMFRQIRQLCEDMVCKPPSIT
eukprot:Em0003g1353a